MFINRQKSGLTVLLFISFAFLCLLGTQDSSFAQSNGSIIRVAGTGTAGFSADGGLATSAKINVPRGIFIDPQKNLYIAETGNYRVRRVTADGIISTVAGTGIRRVFGDGGPATSAGFELLVDVAMDSAGNLYVADSSWAQIRKVNPEGIISTVTNTDFIIGTAVDDADNFYYSEIDLWDSSRGRIQKVTPDGIISTVAGWGTEYPGDGSPATSVELRDLGKIAVDRAGNLYLAESRRIRMVGPDGIISTVAGNGISGHSGDGDLPVLAQIDPFGIAVDPYGNLYIAETGNNCIRKVTTDGMIETILTGLNEPYDIELGPEGNLYIAERNGNRILKTQVYSPTTITAMYFPEVIAGNGWSTLFTIANTGSAGASGTMVFRNPQGNPLIVYAELTDSTGTTLPLNSASSLAVTIPPHGTIFLEILSSDNPDEMQTGWAQLEATGGLLSGMATYEYAYGAYTELFFSIPSSPLLQFASIPFHNDAALGKQIAYVIANPGSAAASVNLALVDQAGYVVDESIALEIGPGQQIAKYLWQDLGCPNFRGSVIFYSNDGQPFVIFALVEKQGLFTALPVASAE